METKKNSNRGRPKKDYGELKSKIAQETAENKGKLGRGRPKKQRNIDDSMNTKISNHHKDISILEKKNKEIHENIKLNGFSVDSENKCEKYSKIALLSSIAFCILAILYYFLAPYRQNINNGKLSKSNNIDTENITTQIQVGYNDKDGNFVEMENIEVNDDIKGLAYDEHDNINVKSDEINNNDIALINSFYDNINNREFSELSKMTDHYLRASDPYKKYFNESWLNNFLDKITGNKIFVGGVLEVPSDKENVKHYGYTIKYKLNNENNFRQEDREIAIVERNGERLIGSIMCVTKGCSRMPFFQK